MSIKEQIRDYDAAFNRARSSYGTGAYDDATLEFLFPQLKEDEDEKRVKEEMDEMWLEYCEDVDYLVYSSIARHFAEWGAEHLKK